MLPNQLMAQSGWRGECLGNPARDAGIRGSIPGSLILQLQYFWEVSYGGGVGVYLQSLWPSPHVGHVVPHRPPPASMTKPVCSWGAIGIGPTSQGVMAPTSGFFSPLFYIHFSINFWPLIFGGQLGLGKFWHPRVDFIQFFF